MKEIEVLVSLEDTLSEAKNKLCNFKLHNHKKTIDTYYTHKKLISLHPSSSGRLSSCLRIRENNQDCFMTYKKDHFSPTDEWLYSDELETKVESAYINKEILTKLGFYELVIVNSDKYTYHYDKNFHLILENVLNLGVFLEIEYSNNSDITDVDTIKNEIRQRIKDLGFVNCKEMNAGKP